MNKEYVQNKETGYTPIELLLYAAIFAVSAAIVTGVVINLPMFQGSGGSAEVNGELGQVLTTVQRLVQRSSEMGYAYEGDSTSTPCATYCTLELKVPSGSGSQDVWITSNANGVYLQQGTVNPPVALTSDQVKVNNFQFTIYNVPGKQPTVQVDASFSYNTTNPELAFTKALESVIGHVSAATFDSSILPSADNSLSIGQGSPTLRWQNLYLSGAVGPWHQTADFSPPSSPGFIYYNVSSSAARIYNGTSWSNLSPFVPSGSNAYLMGGNVGIGTSGPARG